MMVCIKCFAPVTTWIDLSSVSLKLCFYFLLGIQNKKEEEGPGSYQNGFKSLGCKSLYDCWESQPPKGHIRLSGTNSGQEVAGRLYPISPTECKYNPLTKCMELLPEDWRYMMSGSLGSLEHQEKEKHRKQQLSR
jgi:hypothetical protein